MLHTDAVNSRLESIAAVVERGDGVDAWHSASVAVVNGSGQLVARFGDPDLVCFARSSIKPLQALALVRSGAFDAFGITLEELALACASHSGTDEHVRGVQTLLARSGARPADLACGAHLPIEYRLEERVATSGEDRDPLRHNCSGKHAGFLAIAARLGEDRTRYLEPGSKTQTLVRALVAQACEVPEPALIAGVDGCSAPNYALSLRSLARGLSKVAAASAVSDPGSPDLAAALELVRSAMVAHPRLVSGDKRLDYDLMRSFPGNVVCKGGAEAVQLLAFREPPLAIAIKIHDGASRALGCVTVAVLRQLGIAGVDVPPLLARHAAPVLKNHRGLITGAIRATLTLHPVPG